jgi:predicted outer membrane repeat protein
MVALLLVGYFAIMAMTSVSANAASPEPDSEVAAQSQNVGINGAPCAYGDIAGAALHVSDGDTIYVDVSVPHVGTVIGVLDHNITIAAATHNCQTPTDTLAIVDGSGQQWSFTGGMAEIDSGTTVTLSNVRLQNTHAYRGGIVYVRQNGHLVMDNAELISGTAEAEAGAIYVYTGSSLLMTNGSAIYGNEVTQTFGTGAGVSIESGSMTMRDSYVGGPSFNGSANNGGGVSLQEGSLYMYDSLIVNNIAVNKGGGVYADERSIVEMHGASLIGLSGGWSNHAASGGGFYLSNGSSLDVYDDGYIGDNYATEYGGGLYITSESEVSLHDPGTGLYTNTATFGGGAYVTGKNTALLFQGGPHVKGNQALAPSSSRVANGGGIYVTGGARLYGGGVTLSGNYADLSGGAIYAAQDGAVDPTDLLFANGSLIWRNISAYGGGLYMAEDGSRATLYDTELRANGAFTTGGGIRIFGDSEVTLRENSFLTGNIALSGHGGGIAMLTGSLVITEDTELWANEAMTQGGGIYQAGGVLEMTNGRLYDNAAYRGGGLSIEEATAVLTNVQLTFNRADDVGGGIAAFRANLQMNAKYGGACEPRSLAANAYCSEIRSNEAEGAGAGIHLEDASAYLRKTAFIDNTGLPFGGAPGDALYVGPSVSAVVYNGLFTGHGTRGNEAVYVAANGYLLSDNSTFAGNQDVPLYVDSQGAASLSRNIIWDNGKPAGQLNNNISANCNDTQSLLSVGTGNISQDPRFTTTPRGDYRLGAGSPAVDACPLGAARYDLDGWPRDIVVIPSHAQHNDMGAFERPDSIYIPLVLRQY